MTRQHAILATAGHVDHGKSALVKALTGTDPDRLPEEKARGITIDLGFAQLSLAAAPPASDSGLRLSDSAPPVSSYELGVIDVPGHEDFVKNMVTGVGSIDLALLVVAADDGWMPQTEEHLQILSYLGVRHGVVALTKVDLAKDEAASLEAVRGHLQGSPFRNAPIVATSALTGRGLSELRNALTQVVSVTPRPPDLGRPRLSVDRVFVVHGAGTVVTGTLSGGRLHRGQDVRLQPRDIESRIRGLQSHHQETETADPGMRLALNLADVDAEGDIARGDVVTVAEAGGPTLTLDVVLHKSPRLLDSQAAAARPLKDGSLVRVHLGSTNVPARLRLGSPSPLVPGQEAIAQLRLERPLLAFVGDRFVVRDWPEQATLAGGTVLDPRALRPGWLHATRQHYLQACRLGVESPADLTRAWLQYHKVARRSDVLQQAHFSPEDIRAGCESVIAAGKAYTDGVWLADLDWWQQIRAEAQRLIDRHHEHHPEQPGLSLTDIRGAFAARVPDRAVLDVVLGDLVGAGYRVQGQHVKRADFRPALPSHLQAAGDRLRRLLADQPLDVPSRKELAADSTSQQALRYLMENGEAVELSPEVVIGVAAWNRARVVVRRVLRERGRATTSELRQALGSSRRITIPLLELLDRQGVTQRDGDQRTLRG